MALLANALANALENLEPTDSEPAAISAVVDAWEVYFTDAVMGTPAPASVTPGSLSAALSAMEAAMSGISLPNGAAVAISSGITAFWGVAAVQVATIWIAAPVVLIPPAIPPTGLAALAASLAAVFVANLAAERDLPAAASAMASAIHLANTVPPATSAGTIPPAVPAVFPIL